MKEVKRFRHEPAFMVCDADGDYVLSVDYLICELELKDFQWGASVEADAGDEARAEVSRLKAENSRLRAALEMIKHATSDAHDDGAHHENAYSIADSALQDTK